DAQTAARFAPTVAEVVAKRAQHWQPRENRVAIDAVTVRARLAHDELHAELAREVGRLIGRRHQIAVLPDDLLQSDDVGIHLGDDDTQPIQIATPIQPDAAMDVVRGDGDRGHAADSRPSRSTYRTKNGYS